MFLGSKVGPTALQPSVSRLSRQCGILNISQPYMPPWSVTGIASNTRICVVERSERQNKRQIYFACPSKGTNYTNRARPHVISRD
jgi:hypothetical protein